MTEVLKSWQKTQIVSALETAKTIAFPVQVTIAQSKQSMRFLITASDGIKGMYSNIEEHLKFYGKTHFNNLGYYDQNSYFISMVTDADVLECIRYFIVTSQLKAFLQIHAYDDNDQMLEPPPYSLRNMKPFLICGFILFCILSFLLFKIFSILLKLRKLRMGGL